jgi:phospholipase C
MTRKEIWKATSASLAMAAMVINTAAAAEPALTLATTKTSIGEQYARISKDETKLTTAEKLKLLQSKIRYVFVIFQENRSFDGYFGTYPGANGLLSTYPGADPTDPYAMPANKTTSYVQNIRNTDGTYSQISPFLSPRTIKDVNGNTVQLYPESSYSVDHSHTGYIADFHLDVATKSMPQNDGYALDQEGLEYATASNSTAAGNVVTSSSSYPPTTSAPTSNPSLSSKQKGEVAISHRDCDSVPFLWQYADIGTLFDNLHQTIVGPSTPNAIAMISAQSGATQWALHPGSTGLNAGQGAPYAVPNETDTQPFAGSNTDTFAGKPPHGPDEASFSTCAAASTVITGTYNNLACPAPATTDPAYGSYTDDAVVALDGPLSAYANPQLTLTFASLPLSFMGADIYSVTARDSHAAMDLSDVQHDINTIARNNPSVAWGWYQQGFGPEPFDGQVVVDGFPANTPHPSYIVHHNGPQYFGYLGDNPNEVAKMHSLSQFYTDIASTALPNRGVFYIRGGYYNNDGLSAADPSPAAQTEFSGNDDHGSYSDSQISEAQVADAVNAIAASPYWPNSAIIITYDESDGFYDHAPEAIRSFGPDGLPLSGGPRIPTIVLSPYASAHAVSHVYSEHGSIIQFINKLFGLTPLSDLPDERRAQAAAAANPAFNAPNGQPQTELAPNDGKGVGNMFEAFDNDRLKGIATPIPASAVMISPSVVHTLPHYGGAGCTTLKITPTDYPNGYSVGGESDPPPQDWNPRPTIAPGIPYLEETIYGGVVQTGEGWTP